MTHRLQVIALMSALMLGACDGQHEQAGEKADQAAGVNAGPLSPGPSEQVGEIQDRTERDQKKVVEAQADAAEDRADEVRATADQRADALEKQAADIRRSAKQAGKSLDRQADELRGKAPAGQ
jgi:hypothetical protein